MNDKELFKQLQEMSQYAVLSAREVLVLRDAANRIKYLSGEHADSLLEIINEKSVCRDADTGWVTLMRGDNGAVNAARELVDMGLWEENPESADDIEDVQFRRIQGDDK